MHVTLGAAVVTVVLDPILVTLIGFTEPPAEIEIPNHPLDESMGSRKVLAAPLCCVSARRGWGAPWGSLWGSPWGTLGGERPRPALRSGSPRRMEHGIHSLKSAVIVQMTRWL